jgi:hypothetical protein
MTSNERLSLPVLALYGIIGIVISGGVFALYLSAVGSLGNQLLTGLSVFTAGASAFTSVLIVIFYIQQTNILSAHADILEVHSELMEMQYIPRISTVGEPKFESDSFTQTIENRGAGTATELELVTHVEFDNSESYESPLKGRSEMTEVSSGNRYLEGHHEGSFESDCFLEVTGLSGETKRRGFENVVSNLHSEGVSRIRVSLHIHASGQGDHESNCTALPEEYFYSDLKRGEGFSLESRYRVSSPR